MWDAAVLNEGLRRKGFRNLTIFGLLAVVLGLLAFRQPYRQWRARRVAEEQREIIFAACLWEQDDSQGEPNPHDFALLVHKSEPYTVVKQDKNHAQVSFILRDYDGIRRSPKEKISVVVSRVDGYWRGLYAYKSR